MKENKEAIIRGLFRLLRNTKEFSSIENLEYKPNYILPWYGTPQEVVIVTYKDKVKRCIIVTNERVSGAIVNIVRQAGR